MRRTFLLLALSASLCFANPAPNIPPAEASPSVSPYTAASISAQNVACIANAALAAGYPAKDWKTVADMIDSLSGTGVVVYPSNSRGHPMAFHVPSLTEEEKKEIEPFLHMIDEPFRQIIFRLDPGASAVP